MIETGYIMAGSHVATHAFAAVVYQVQHSMTSERV